MTAIIIVVMDISHINPDLKKLFRRSRATTDNIRIAATVLICNLQPSEFMHVSLSISRS